MCAATLVLEDGTVIVGQAFGAATDTVFELVFNTSMTGYQEILTDPSYRGQGVLLTASHIGNVGINREDYESAGPQVAAVVVRSLSPAVSNWRAERDLSGWLAEHGVPGISGVDTRWVTRLLRDRGTMKAALSTQGTDPVQLLAMARAWPGLDGVDMVKEATCAEPYVWTGDAGDRWVRPQTSEVSEDLGGREAASSTSEVSEDLGGREAASSTSEVSEDLRGREAASSTSEVSEDLGGREAASSTSEVFRDLGSLSGPRVVLYDFGAKRNILRHLAAAGMQVIVVPADTPAGQVLAMHPDGVMLSNGPGDPAGLPYAVEAVRQLIAFGLPVFGICLGHQLIGRAMGGTTSRLKFGHHGGNHPVKDLRTGEVAITAQNHNYQVDIDSLDSAQVEITHLSLNDGSLEGMRLRHRPVFCVQYHPEAAPGPHDAHGLFGEFLGLLAVGG